MKTTNLLNDDLLVAHIEIILWPTLIITDYIIIRYRLCKINFMVKSMINGRPFNGFKNTAFCIQVFRRGKHFLRRVGATVHFQDKSRLATGE